MDPEAHLVSRLEARCYGLRERTQVLNSARYAEQTRMTFVYVFHESHPILAVGFIHTCVFMPMYIAMYMFICVYLESILNIY